MNRILILLVLIVISCKKDKEDKDTSLLTEKKWKYETAVLSPEIMLADSSFTNDYLAFLKDCEKDDYYFFSADSIYFLHEGEEKCDPKHPDYVQYGTWKWHSDKAYLYTRTHVDTALWKINKLEKNSMSATFPIKIKQAEYSLSATFIAE
jgi:hypothetical protein